MGATSLFRGLLWILSAALSLFLAAITVSPQEAVANITRWLNLFGLRGSSDWFLTEANHKIRLSPDSIMHAMTAECAKPPCAHAVNSGVSFYVPEITLIAFVALVAALILIWIVRRRPSSLLEGMERRGF
jgi:hypothetical protein